MKTFFALLLTLVSLSSFAVTVDVTDLRGKGGTLMVAVFDDAGQFPDKKPLLAKEVLIAKGLQSTSIELNLPEGDYAISMFLDENGNKKLDANFLRIPKELFGFSKNPRILTGAPSYQDCEIRVNAQTRTTVKLIKFL